MTDNLKKYNEVFCNIFEVREDDLENMKLKESANWDSVGHINLISSLEETFDINMEPEDMFEITRNLSYDDIRLLNTNKSEKNGKKINIEEKEDNQKERQE